MIVDLHTRIWDSPEQLGAAAAALSGRGRGSPYDQRPNASTAAHEQAMGVVDAAVVLGLESRSLGAKIGIEQVARYVARQPGKLIGFAGIDPMEEAFLTSVELAIEAGLAGVVISPAGQDYHPTHSRAMRLYERCQEKRLPIVVEPGVEWSPGSKMEFAQPHLLDEVARTFAKLKLVVACVGHPWVEATLALLAKHENVYASLCGVVGRPLELYTVLRRAVEQQVTDRLVFASGFPLLTPEQAMGNLYAVPRSAQAWPLPVVERDVVKGIVERDTLAALGVARPVGKSSWAEASSAEAGSQETR